MYRIFYKYIYGTFIKLLHRKDVFSLYFSRSDHHLLCDKSDLNNVYNYQMNLKNKALVATFHPMFEKITNQTAEVYVCCEILHKIFYLGVRSTDSVKVIKRKIQDLSKIPIRFQNLFFNNVLLSNKRLLYHYSIPDQSTLKLGIKLHYTICSRCYEREQYHKSVELILTTLAGEKLRTSVPLSSPVDQLKLALEAKYNIAVDNQLILLDGITILNDVPLIEYGITSSSFLHILILDEIDDNLGEIPTEESNNRPTVNIHFLNHTITWTLNYQTTIRRLKQTMYKYLGHIHPDLQQIYFENTELEDKHTLQYYEVDDGDILYIKLRFNKRSCCKCHGILL